MADSDFLRILAGIAFRHRCRIKGLCLRSPARRLARPLAPATVGVFRSYRRPLQAFPLMRSQGDGCPGRTSPSLPLEGKVPPKGADEASPPQRRKAPVPAAAGYFAPRRERFLCLRRPHFFQQRKKWGKERRQKPMVFGIPFIRLQLRCKKVPQRIASASTLAAADMVGGGYWRDYRFRRLSNRALAAVSGKCRCGPLGRGNIKITRSVKMFHCTARE